MIEQIKIKQFVQYAENQSKKIRSNVKSLYKDSDLSQEEFALKCGISRGTLYNIISNKGNLDEGTLHKIANACTVTYKWLIGEEEKVTYVGESPPGKKYKKGVPVYNADFTASDITQFEDEREKVIGYVDLEGFRKCKFIVRVKGPSMEPDFKTGDFIGLEELSDFKIIEYGQPYAITTKNKQKLFKIIRRGKDNDHLILRSISPEHDDIDIHRSDILKLFKVRGPIRDQWQ